MGSKITLQKLEEAYHMADSGNDFCTTFVYFSRSTGEYQFFSDFEEEFDEDLIEELENDNDYIEMPDKRELDLGQPLVWEFVEMEIPEFRHSVQAFFTRRGAYSKFKAFLEGHNLLDKWYAFEEKKTREALLEWARENDIEVYK